MALGETLQHARDRITKPTDVQFANRFLDNGIRHVVSVPCSITATVDAYWSQLAEEGRMYLWKMVSEHSLGGVSGGVYFGGGEQALVHMQNSGVGTAADALISYAAVYKIPTVAIVTWRGNNREDDSEPHQEIGKRTDALTRDVTDRKSIFGEKGGRGILREVEKALEWTRAGNVSILRLSPDAFTKTYPQALVTLREEDPTTIEELGEELRREKGDSPTSVFKRDRVSREEAIKEIILRHPRAAILFSNGFTAREAQDKADRLGNFYNAGYMGGGLAIGWGMTMSNSDIEVVVVDGDQNSEMGKMHEILANQYSPNLYWYILDNGFGTSVGVSESVPLPYWYYDLAHVIRTVPDKPGEFVSPRVGKRGVYFDMDEARSMADRIGPLPAHAQRFKHWVEMVTQENRAYQTTQ